MIISKTIERIKASSYIKNSLILTSGTIVAQIIPLAFYPILARIYTPSDFGVLATVISITAVISVIATGKYETAILITDTKRLAANMVWLILIIAFFSLSIIEVLFYFSSDFISESFKVPSLKYWVYICPPTAFLIVIYQSYNEWCVRNKYFVNLSLNKITNTGSMTLAKALFGWTKILNGGLIIGELLGRIITAVSCIRLALKKDKEEFFSPSFRQMKWLSKRYIECPKLVLPAQLLNILGGELPVLLLLTAFSITQIGYYSMAISVLALPASIISLAVRDTFRKQANDIYKQTGNCFSIYMKTLSAMGVISIVGFSLFYLIAPQLFSFVLGKEWFSAGEYARILCPIVAISFVSETGSSMFIIAEKMKMLLLWQILYFLLTLTSILIGIYFFKDIKSTLYCFMIGRSATHLLSLFMTSRFAKGK